MTVRAKKHLGQHFLTDLNIAKRIADSLPENHPSKVLEVGPGMGVLTQFLLQQKETDLSVVEIDTESVVYLREHYPELKIIEGDFLRLDLSSFFSESFALIGNFPYNISSQIFFKLLEYRNQIPCCVGMIQKEVAERLAEAPGSKTYGILSVLLQAYYDIEYLFTVNENVFNPPPKVKSAVIRLTRNQRQALGCDEKLFTQIVKATFGQRRKQLRNTLKPFVKEESNLLADDYFMKRPEQLSVDDFIGITKRIEGQNKEKSQNS
jgi:16S rRNA (adenine1518-N6/adenine1519-N6)-dimethyltransferase